MTSSDLRGNVAIKSRSSIRRLFKKEKKPPTAETNDLPSSDVERPDVASNDSSGTGNTSSPVNKRRGFNSRKWLPPPLRKLSQGKVEKPQGPPDRPPLKKTGSDKRIKVPPDMGNKPSVSEGEEDDERLGPPSRTAGQPEMTNGGGDDADEEVELPPPMKPIQEPILVTAVPPSVPGIPSIEEQPGKREQHSENQERNSLVRETKSADALTECGEGGSRQQELTLQSVSSEGAGNALSGDESDKIAENAVDSGIKSVDTQLRKRQFVLKELFDTEKAYVNDLELIVYGYMKVMRDPDSEILMPEDLRDGKDRMVFGNIEVIYDFHKDVFCNGLERCIEMPSELGPLFKKYERKLRMYVVYCKNKPVSEYIVSEYLETYFEELRIFLGHKLQICDLLIKPVQRIMKYQLLLRDILKYSERAGLTSEIENLRAAVEVMTVVPQAANNMMDVGRLQGFNGNITQQGQLLLNGPLICSDLPGSANPCIGKNKELHVFLFEQSMIFSEAVGKKTQFTSPRYVYKAHIQINKICLSPPAANSETFTLKSTDLHKPTQGFVCQAPSPEMYEKWVSTLDDIFQTQKDFLTAIQSPIAYQNKLTKDPVDMSSLWCPNSPSRRSAPVSSSTPASPTSTKAPHRNTVPIHKANTIGIPPDPDSSSATENKQGKKFMFGFRNTLRSKSKTEPLSDSNKDNDKNDMQRSWCENGQTTVS